MSTAQSSPRFTSGDLIAATVVVVIWGLNFVAMKIGLRSFTPFQLGAARYVFAALPLALFVPRPKVAWKWLVLFGLFQGVLQFGLLFLALRVGMSASLASVLMQTQVFFTALFSFALLNERLTRSLQIGLSIAALAILCFALNYIGPTNPAATPTTVAGFLLSLGAASMWAGSNIIARRVQKSSAEFDAFGFVVWSSIVPILPFCLISLIFDDPGVRWNWLAAPWQTWLAVAYLGWIATILAYGLWTGLLKRHAANTVAPFSLAVPLVGLCAGIFGLGETISAWQWVGSILVVCALLTTLLGPRWSTPPR